MAGWYDAVQMIIPDESRRRKMIPNKRNRKIPYR